MTREEQLKQEYESKLAALRAEQDNCNHEWDTVKYDPEIQKIPVFDDRYIGSDYMPEFAGFDEKKIDRWSRTCKKCGKVEYTKGRVATHYEPKF
jgi:hypothetical protein